MTTTFNFPEYPNGFCCGASEYKETTDGKRVYCVRCGTSKLLAETVKYNQGWWYTYQPYLAPLTTTPIWGGPIGAQATTTVANTAGNAVTSIYYYNGTLGPNTSISF